MSCVRMHEPVSFNSNPQIIVPKLTIIKGKVDIPKLSNIEKWCCPNCKSVFEYDDPWLVEKEAAEVIRFDHETLNKWRYLEKWDIPFVRIGRAIRYPLSGILKFKADLKKKMELQLMP